MQHKDTVILNKIISELNIALDAIDEVDYEEFNSDEMFKRGICMTVINIGELVKNLSFEFREEHKQIPWKAVAGFRDIAAHKYQTLNMKDVYATVITDFPELKSELQKILSE